MHNSSKKNTILIIDDSKSNILALNYILSSDYIILATKSGQNGIDISIKQVPDLILLDIMMPDVDGFEVLRILRENPKTQDIPIIIISGLNNNQGEEKSLRLGANDYISKPFSPIIVKLRVLNQMKIINQLRAIETLSMTDPLTKIFNRRAVETRMEENWKKSVINGSHLAILIVDIDNFKNINDTYGHPYGDIILERVTEIIKNTLRRSADYVGRWGGEEFIIVLPNTNMIGAIQVGEEIRKNVSNSHKRYSDESIKSKTTISIGVYSSIPKNTIDNTTVYNFISNADEALYQAKNTGKNKVVSYNY